mmetsp:Transcript_92981/g.259897  ORF Transcript_92981/g.259897 Transcript_92981/m.259897 type:complete len:322 (-) Transcript_92981:35-1000(-)
MLFQEGIHPIEVAMIRQPDREDDLVLAAVRLGRLGQNNIGDCSGGNHVATERKRRQRGRPEVHLEGHVPEGDRRKERLPQKRLRDRLRRAGADAVREEAHSVRVGARGVEVKEEPQRDLPAVLGADLLPRRRRDKEALAIEASALVLRLSQEQRRAGVGDTDPAKLSLRHVAGGGSSCLWADVCLDDPHLEHVAARLHADCTPRARDQVLPAAIGEHHQHRAFVRRHDIHRGVRGVDPHRASGDLGSAVNGGVLLGLDRLVVHLFLLAPILHLGVLGLLLNLLPRLVLDSVLGRGLAALGLLGRHRRFPSQPALGERLFVE